VKKATKTITVKPGAMSLGKLVPGDVVAFDAGRYTQGFKLANVSGTPDSPIVIETAESGEAVFDGAEPIELKWEREAGNIFVARSSVAPHGLCLDGRMLVHSMEDGEIPSGQFRVSGNGPWMVCYHAPDGKTPEKCRFTRGVRPWAIQLENCSHIALSGFRMKNFGVGNGPVEIYGQTIFGSGVVEVAGCEHVTIEDVEIEGFFGAGVLVDDSSHTVLENLRIRAGYGKGIHFHSNQVGEPSSYCENNTIRNCGISGIRRFSEEQRGFMVKGIGINGNRLKGTTIENCVLHDIHQKALHFDVRNGWATVRNCLFFRNPTAGVEVYLENRIHDVLIENNIFCESGGVALLLGRCLDITIRHNTFHRPSQHALGVVNAYNFSIDDNVIYEPGGAWISISEAALNGEMFDRGKTVADGKLLHDFIKHEKPDISISEMNERLVWAGVAPLNPDGTEPDDISWKSVEELMGKGVRAISARDNPNGNGIDLPPPECLRNSVRGNMWWKSAGMPFAIARRKYELPNEMERANASFEDFFSTNPGWDEGLWEKATFKSEEEFDLRTGVSGVGASDDALLWARDQIRGIGSADYGIPARSAGSGVRGEL